MTNRKLQMQFLVVLLIATLVLSFFIFKPFLAPLALAAVFAVVLYPLYRKMLHYTKNRESIASLITVCISIICILVPLTLLSTQIFQESKLLYGSLTDTTVTGENVAGVIQKMGHSLETIAPGAEAYSVTLSNDLDVYAKRSLQWIINNLGSTLSSISALLMDLFIFFIALYYLLRDGHKLKKALVSLSPLKDTDDEMIFGKLTTAVNSVVKGNLIIALIQGILTAIGLTIFAVPHSILWGTCAAIAALIPGFGTVLIILPAIIYLFFVGHPFSAIGLFVWGSFGVGLIDNLLGPKLIGKGMQLHPLFILLSVIGGIIFFGPIGIFLGPLSLSLLSAFMSIYTFFMNQLMK